MSPATSTPRSYPFAIANAFTQDAFGGNPAAIVFLDPSNTLTQEERLKFAKGFNQPVVVFLTPTSTSTEDLGAVVSFDVQYFAPACEIELCGHGTVAAIKVILDSATDSPGFGRGTPFPAFSSPGTHTVEFITANKTVVSARKVGMTNEVSGKEEDWFEIVLPAGKLRNLPTEEEEKILGIFNRAVGRESKVKYIGIGEPPFQHDLLIVLDEDEEIEKLKLNAEVLVGGVLGFPITETDVTCERYRKPPASIGTSSPQIPLAGNLQRITSPGCSLPFQVLMKITSAVLPTARWVPTGRPRKASRS